MRDPERIARMLKKLELAWTASPDMRLGQLIDNMIFGTYSDIFVVEDDQMEKGMDFWIGKADEFYDKKTGKIL